jgi:hypothetical protein
MPQVVPVLPGPLAGSTATGGWLTGLTGGIADPLGHSSFTPGRICPG